jgi:glutamate transport system permease protein
MTNVLYDVPGPKARRLSRIVSVVGLIVIAIGLAAVILALAAPRVTASGTELPGMFDPSRWDILADRAVWRGIADGLWNTLAMAGVAAVGALLLGVLISFARTARAAWIRYPMVVVLEFLRGMPVLLMMLFILLIFSTGAYWAGVVALALYNGAIIGEALRAGIAALPRGQREAGLAIGLGHVRTRLSIEFPQAFRQMLPIIIAQLVVLLKDTSLAYVIGYPELLRTTTVYMTNYYGSRYLFTLFFVAFAIYLTMNLLLSWLARVIARRVQQGRIPPGSSRISRRAEKRIAKQKVDDAFAKAQSDQSLQAGGPS